MPKQSEPYTTADLLTRHSQGIHKPTGKVFKVKSRQLTTDGVLWFVSTDGDRYRLDEVEHYNPFGDL